MKTCTKCDVEKPLSSFYKDKKTKDGHRYRCKDCEADNPAIIERNRRYRLRNPGKGRGGKPNPAHNKVENELRRKRLVRQDNCEICNVPYKVHAHHPDYSQPLFIVWVCRRCHAKLHAAIDAARRKS